MCECCGRVATTYLHPHVEYVCGLCRPKEFSDDTLDQIMMDFAAGRIT